MSPPCMPGVIALAGSHGGNALAELTGVCHADVGVSAGLHTEQLVDELGVCCLNHRVEEVRVRGQVDLRAWGAEGRRGAEGRLILVCMQSEFGHDRWAL